MRSMKPLIVHPQIRADERFRPLIHELYVGVHHVASRMAEHKIGKSLHCLAMHDIVR